MIDRFIPEKGAVMGFYIFKQFVVGIIFSSDREKATLVDCICIYDNSGWCTCREQLLEGITEVAVNKLVIINTTEAKMYLRCREAVGQDRLIFDSAEIRRISEHSIYFSDDSWKF